MVAEMEPLITAGYVGHLLGCSTETVRKMAKRGELPGAVSIGKHIKFDPVKFYAWLEAGGDSEQPKFIFGRHGHRAHAGSAIAKRTGLPKPRWDTKPDRDKALAELVKPDLGVRPFDGAPDLARVPARQYLPGGAA